MCLKLLLNVVIINFIRAAYVGENCTPSEDVSNGICTVVTECKVAVSLLKKQGRHDFTRCGFIGAMEIVCCPQTTTKFDDSTASPQRSLRIADRECQNIISKRFPPLRLNIINGEVAARGEFPHMVALGYLRDNGYNFDCGGTLISSTYVITAAHCVDTLEGIEPTIARVGVAELGGSDWDKESDFRISNITRHPEYLKREKYHDLALIRLEKAVKTSGDQGPACLYTNSQDPETKLTVTGWGTTNTSTNAKSVVLLKADLFVVPREQCSQNYMNWRKLPRGISDDQICAKDPRGLSDTCQGDSGGPLQDTTQPDDVARIVGVTSFGNGCATSAAGVYTRISRYLDWIESVVWPN